MWQASRDMGAPVEYLYPRHKAAVAWMSKEHGAAEYREGDILSRWRRSADGAWR